MSELRLRQWRSSELRQLPSMHPMGLPGGTGACEVTPAAGGTGYLSANCGVPCACCIMMGHAAPPPPKPPRAVSDINDIHHSLVPGIVHFGSSTAHQFPSTS